MDRRLKPGALRMSSPTTKSVKKLASRSNTRQSTTSSERKRAVSEKSSRLKPATKRSIAGKAPARKATKSRNQKIKTRPQSTSSKTRGTGTKTKVKKAAPRRSPKATKKPVGHLAARPAPVVPKPQPTHDEAAALSAFDAAHREFTRGHFSEAR